MDTWIFPKIQTYLGGCILPSTNQNVPLGFSTTLAPLWLRQFFIHNFIHHGLVRGEYFRNVVFVILHHLGDIMFVVFLHMDLKYNWWLYDGSGFGAAIYSYNHFQKKICQHFKHYCRKVRRYWIYTMYWNFKRFVLFFIDSRFAHWIYWNFFQWLREKLVCCSVCYSTKMNYDVFLYIFF